MSPFGIASTLSSLFPSTKSSVQANTTGTSSDADFSSSLTLRMAALQAQSLNLLIGSTSGGNGKTSSSLDFLTGTKGTSSNSSDLFSLLGLSASNRNLSLFDPESAYKMMSVINTEEVTYKAQFSELSNMKTAVAGMQQVGLALGKVSVAMDNETIKTQLQTFAGQYNDWINRFDGTVKRDGILTGTQAAEISLHELEQSVANPFNGAKDGFRGLQDLGFTIDPNTDVASIDMAKLDTALANNKSGAINTISEFSTNFAKSAELLDSSNNFIPNRLSNLDRVIDYITDNKPSLQAEFGSGDPAKPSAQVSKALASYMKISGV